MLGLICGYCNECKNQQLSWDLYVVIVMNVKTNEYDGTYMGVLHI